MTRRRGHIAGDKPSASAAILAGSMLIDTGERGTSLLGDSWRKPENGGPILIGDVATFWVGALHPVPSPAKLEAHPSTLPYCGAIEMAKELAVFEHSSLSYRPDGVIQCYELDYIDLDGLELVRRTAGVNYVLGAAYVRGRYEEFIELYNAAVSKHHPGRTDLFIARR